MTTIMKSASTAEAPRHKRTTSSVLKSMMAPRNHKRNPSAGAALSSTKTENVNPNPPHLSGDTPHLPLSQNNRNQPLGEVNQNRERSRSSPRKPLETSEEDQGRPGLYKRTKSSVSLKALVRKDREKSSKKKPSEDPTEGKPKKSKSSTNLAALLSRPKSSRGPKQDGRLEPKDKENRTPPNSAGIALPPIWAQFASQPTQEIDSGMRVPLNDVKDEMALYSPREYCPSKQRNFNDHQQPTLSRRPEPKQRPKSAFLASGPSTTSFAETLSGLRKKGTERHVSRRPCDDTTAQHTGENQPTLSSESKPSSRRSSIDDRKSVEEPPKSGMIMAKRGSRVAAAVAVFNGKSKELDKDTKAEPKMDIKAIDSAFETLLDSRNIPQNMREKMRALDTVVKADFIKHDQSESGSASSLDGLSSNTSSDRPIGKRSKTTDGIAGHDEVVPQIEEPGSPIKKSRPRSRTFTFSKGDPSPSKKQKGERPLSQASPHELTQSGSSKSLTSNGTTQEMALINRAPKTAVPEDFISYLRKVQMPQLVEVRRLHKLRQLLRNETITWVDSFITKGGMADIVGLLHRTMEVEWREEHEDTLLHETLLCLKALCTTSLALHHLSSIQSTLFPALLGMLFDEAKKGPSEFSTRSIIISLFFTYLSTSPPDLLVSRAHTLLAYLHDPAAPEDAQPPGFITSIYHPRPYRIWCKEVVNVTKEVFWIFLHHLNVIPYPINSDSAPEPSSYTTRHFPRDRPPVPAAPYVGGVEWEATNYLAAHLDLLNALVAALPSCDERNALRQELRDSGFEKCMGNSLRTCKEKFYGAVHAGLGTWVGAGREDGWDVRGVREGCREEGRGRASPKKVRKGNGEEAPRLEMPRLELGGGDGVGAGWL